MTTIFRRAIGAAAIIAVAGVGVIASGPVAAVEIGATGTFDTILVAEGVGSADAIDGLTVELFVDNGDSVGGDVLAEPSTSCEQSPPSSGVAYTERTSTCTDVPAGDYIIGLDGIPDGWDVEIDCDGFGPPEALEGTTGSSVTLAPDSTASCLIFVIQPADLGVAIFAPTYDTSILDALTLEAFTDPGGVQSLSEGDCRSETGIDSDGDGPYRLIECDLAAGTYVLGLDGLSDDVTGLFGYCDGLIGEQLDSESFSFLIEEGITECDVYLDVEPQVLVDVVVTGGDHASDATIEIFDDGGSLVATTSDPAVALCEPTIEGFTPETDCGIVSLPAGDYEFGVELPDYGYVTDGSVDCTPLETGLRRLELLPGGTGAFTHGETVDGPGPETSSLCTIPLRYVEQTVSADIVVVNDDGGASDGSDFVIEVFDSSGVLVDSAADPEPGTGNASADFTLPIGDYTFGVSAPGGYEVSVVVTPVTLVDAALIDDASAGFTLDRSSGATAVLTAHDTATTTTVAPTTTIDDGSGAAAPTTTLAPTLPATGSGSTSIGLLLAALAMLLLGGGAVALARRI